MVVCRRQVEESPQVDETEMRMERKSREPGDTAKVVIVMEGEEKRRVK